MKPEQSKFKQEEQLEQRQELSQQTQEEKVFGSVEELLRYDNEQNPVPAEVGEKVHASISAEPKRNVPWYKRFF